mmetsp:Transcript_13170/g.42901  ORF Transcript_13170/g.42901 Transcript_13170/m.42901 type:complete len:315 (-) Transcript_13170:179-1123(-)
MKVVVVLRVEEDHFLEEDGDDDVDHDDGVDEDEGDEVGGGEGRLLEEGAADDLGPALPGEDLEEGVHGLEEVAEVLVAEGGRRPADGAYAVARGGVLAAGAVDRREALGDAVAADGIRAGARSLVEGRLAGPVVEEVVADDGVDAHYQEKYKQGVEHSRESPPETRDDLLQGPDALEQTKDPEGPHHPENPEAPGADADDAENGELERRHEDDAHVEDVPRVAPEPLEPRRVHVHQKLHPEHHEEHPLEHLEDLRVTTVRADLRFDDVDEEVGADQEGHEDLATQVLVHYRRLPLPAPEPRRQAHRRRRRLLLP